MLVLFGTLCTMYFEHYVTLQYSVRVVAHLTLLCKKKCRMSIKSVEAKIPKSKQSFFTYLKESNNKSIFLTPCTSIELVSIIKNMKSSKACGPYSIPTNLPIEFSDQLVHPLASIINMSITEGVFPSFCKEAQKE